MAERSEVLAQIAVEAGNLARQMRATATIVVEKGNLNFATSADIASEELIRNRLAVAFPDIPFVGEESIKDGAVPSTAFVVDPIDGTTNFAHGGDDWGVSIGLLENGEPTAGVIYIPSREQLLRCGEGRTLLNDQRVDLSNIAHAAQPRLALCGQEVLTKRADRGEQRWLLELLADYSYVLASASAVVDIMTVAQARTAGMVALTSFSWDVLAGAAAITQAGGFVRTLKGEPVDWSVATTGALVMGSAAFVLDIANRAEDFTQR